MVQFSVAVPRLRSTQPPREAGSTSPCAPDQYPAELQNLSYTTDSLIIAYEPVWAIGTGLTPTLEGR